MEGGLFQLRNSPGKGLTHTYISSYITYMKKKDLLKGIQSGHLLSTANGLYLSSAFCLGWMKNRPIKNVCNLNTMIMHTG